jgi:hypothetical protein
MIIRFGRKQESMFWNLMMGYLLDGELPSCSGNPEKMNWDKHPKYKKLGITIENIPNFDREQEPKFKKIFFVKNKSGQKSYFYFLIYEIQDEKDKKNKTVLTISTIEKSLFHGLDNIKKLVPKKELFAFGLKNKSIAECLKNKTEVSLSEVLAWLEDKKEVSLIKIF